MRRMDYFQNEKSSFSLTKIILALIILMVIVFFIFLIFLFFIINFGNSFSLNGIFKPTTESNINSGWRGYLANKALDIEESKILINQKIKINPFRPKKLADCAKIDDISVPSDCFEELVEIPDDIKPCLEIKDSYFKEQCISVVVKDDDAICQDLTFKNWQGGCYKKIAENRGDENFCYKIIGAELEKNLCLKSLAVQNKNLALCDKISNQTRRDECYRELAEGLNDFKICNKISLEYLRISCFLNIGIANNDLKICDFAGKERNHCYKSVAIALKDKSICERIDVDYFNRPSCFSSCAIENNDLDLCKSVKDFTPREYCILEIAKKRGDASICDLSHSKEKCFYEVATSHKDIDICEKIKEKYKHDECVSFVAISSREPELCKRLKGYSPLSTVSPAPGEPFVEKHEKISVEDEQVLNTCYSRTAKAAKDKKICQNIKDRTLRDTCIKNVTGRNTLFLFIKNYRVVQRAALIIILIIIEFFILRSNWQTVQDMQFFKKILIISALDVLAYSVVYYFLNLLLLAVLEGFYSSFIGALFARLLAFPFYLFLVKAVMKSDSSEAILPYKYFVVITSVWGAIQSTIMIVALSWFVYLIRGISIY